MKATERAKLIVLSAIGLIVLLFVVSLIEIAFVNKANAKLRRQEKQIDSLNKEIEYLENKLNDSTDNDDTNIDIEITK